MGLLFGLALQGGIWSIASAFSFAVIGNAISALQSGELTSLFGGHRHGWARYNRAKRPLLFWLSLIVQFGGGLLLLAVFFYQKGLPPAGLE